MSRDSDGSWETIVGRLDAIERKLAHRKRKLVEVRAAEEAKRSAVVVEAPFSSLRDALSRLVYKGTVAAAVSPDLFLETKDGADNVTDVKRETRDDASQDNEGKVKLEVAPSIVSKEEFQASKLRSESRKRAHEEMLESPSFSSKRRQVALLASLAVDIRQRVNGDIKQMWGSVDLACCHRAAAEIQSETQQLQKVLGQTTASTSSLLSMINSEPRETPLSLPYPQQPLSMGPMATQFSDPMPSPGQPSVMYQPHGYHHPSYYDTHSVAMYSQQHAAPQFLPSSVQQQHAIASHPSGEVGSFYPHRQPATSVSGSYMASPTHLGLHPPNQPIQQSHPFISPPVHPSPHPLNQSRSSSLASQFPSSQSPSQFSSQSAVQFYHPQQHLARSAPPRPGEPTQLQGPSAAFLHHQQQAPQMYQAQQSSMPHPSLQHISPHAYQQHQPMNPQSRHPM